jgi:hypothetical protein
MRSRLTLRLLVATLAISSWLALLLLGTVDPPWVHLLLLAGGAVFPYRLLAAEGSGGEEASGAPNVPAPADDRGEPD